MKKKLLALFAMLIIVMGGVVAPGFSAVSGNVHLQKAYAQAGNATTSGTAGTPQNAADKDNPATKEIDCGLNFVCGAVILYSQFVMFMPNLLATVAGLVMDFSIWYSIQSSTYTQFDDTLDASGNVVEEGLVVKGWKLVRDFTNLVFIFALFVIAFTLILNLDDRKEGAPMGLDPKRTIARVIIMALLVNFSFFLGRSVIDITNVFAQGFYNKITAAPVQNNAGQSFASGVGDPTEFYQNAAGIRSISTGIIAKVNPQALLLDNSEVTGSGVFWKSYDLGTYVMVFFMSTVAFAFNLFLVYIFASLAILFFARTIGLYLGVIISPIAFVSYTVPALQKQAYIGFDDWLKQFLSLSFMAPIFLFFLYIIVQFFQISGLDKATAGKLAVAAQILVKLGLIGFLLVYAKNIAKDLSGKAGELVTSGISSVVSGVAMVGAAVATGGLSGAARMGGRMAYQKATSIAGSAGETIGRTAFGDQKFEAMQKQWKLGGGLKMLDRPLGSSANALMRVATAGDKDGIGTAWKAGKTFNRRTDFANAKEFAAKQKKADAWKEYSNQYSEEESRKRKTKKDIEEKIAKLKKDEAEGLITKEEAVANRKAYQKELDALLPENERKVKEAEYAIRDARSELEKKGVKKKTDQANAVIKGIDKEIANNDRAFKASQEKLGKISQSRKDVEKELGEKSNELSAAEAAHKNVVTQLTNAKLAASKESGDLAKELAALDAKIAAAPKVGFGANMEQLEKMREERNGLALKKRAADQALSSADQELSQTISGYRTSTQSLSDTVSKLEQEKKRLAKEEEAAMESFETNQEKQQQRKADRAEQEKIISDLAGEKSAAEREIARLAKVQDAAKDVIKAQKTVKEIEKEIVQRTAVEKQDAGRYVPIIGDALGVNSDGNRERNAKRVEELQEKIKNIATGGTPPPPTP